MLETKFLLSMMRSDFTNESGEYGTPPHPHPAPDYEKVAALRCRSEAVLVIQCSHPHSRAPLGPGRLSSRATTTWPPGPLASDREVNGGTREDGRKRERDIRVSVPTILTPPPYF